MVLDTSTYNLGLLRIDGRRWNELRQIRAQIRTQAAADGSAYFELGNTKVMCVVSGPNEEGKKRGATSASGAGGGGVGGNAADILVSVEVCGFSTVDRKKRARGDKRTQELQSTLANSLAAVLHTHLFPRSTISLSLHVLSQDGSLLACLINAATLALIDAGVPMDDFLVACSAGSTSSHAANDEQADPLMDLNTQEEQELPFLTIATLGETDKVAVLVCESRVQVSRLEGMMVTAADGCRNIRKYLDAVVKEKGRKMVAEGAVEKGVSMAMDIGA
ncbi:ribosomal protein S5 domain 2-like protein [Annulohypoxylon maeteangense]|uniref:ribosomal protein S5 domain 2-like protein n=1 Tax=Annulohypoxylon maeteangense TaxID=1927788 RepID=UPI002008306B|nr:ribosomal protein S5 domain 2-like protein [Annulohypoxylon maeteangense]KAI0881607.1 ribosomal protein S5 domain 2-like protein [Annulohypoxylon maeteangense]